MENESSKKNNMLFPIVVVALVVIVAVGVYLTQQKPEMGSSTNTTVTTKPTTTNANMYKDGTYTADGAYVSPGGPRDIGVTITLANGLITDTTTEVRATDATSKRLQQEFADNYKQMVVGKSIDEVNLTKVSGSSLTPKGFNDALTKIKTEAKS